MAEPRAGFSDHIEMEVYLSATALAYSLYLQGWGLIDLPLRALDALSLTRILCGSVRRFLCSRNPHFRKWSFDGRSRNHLTALHEMGDGREGEEK